MVPTITLPKLLVKQSSDTQLLLNTQVDTLEQTLRSFPQIDVQTTHVIHGAMCARTIMIPAGTVLTGAPTNADNISILCGDITVTTSTGTKRLAGFHVLPADAGFKRAGVAHSDTYWTTIHHTELTELTEIEKEMTSEYLILQSNTLLLTSKEETLWLG